MPRISNNAQFILRIKFQINIKCSVVSLSYRTALPTAVDPTTTYDGVLNAWNKSRRCRDAIPVDRIKTRLYLAYIWQEPGINGVDEMRPTSKNNCINAQIVLSNENSLNATRGKGGRNVRHLNETLEVLKPSPVHFCTDFTSTASSTLSTYGRDVLRLGTFLQAVKGYDSKSVFVRCEVKDLFKITISATAPGPGSDDLVQRIKTLSRSMPSLGLLVVEPAHIDSENDLLPLTFHQCCCRSIDLECKCVPNRGPNYMALTIKAVWCLFSSRLPIINDSYCIVSKYFVHHFNLLDCVDNRDPVRYFPANECRLGIGGVFSRWESCTTLTACRRVPSRSTSLPYVETVAFAIDEKSVKKYTGAGLNTSS
ncbi:hypothetical protein RF11_07173 [Thelohanellus kitauei]|uniref:Uncharacterized protein n=1 Tax=Thelohanellus kitauei TaxID=669202 RepID=A0A0C2ND66_THEKT|nr:hypothetical protein RF11_07173 [Thelohanellus kitauei]